VKRKDKHAAGPLSTKGQEYAKPCAKNTKQRIRRYDKRAQKAQEIRESDKQ
jgi:hypothetical protein